MYECGKGKCEEFLTEYKKKYGRYIRSIKVKPWKLSRAYFFELRRKKYW
jgi:hypothetical protein